MTDNSLLDYKATILADSISPARVRLTTFEVTFPRFILAEVNTHRVLSRNSNSSRAIPPEKQIERLLASPFVPQFGARVTGMGVGIVFDEGDQDSAQDIWLEARDDMIRHAQRLIDLGADKSRINRLLEPFMWQTAIISATEWDNFFALRTDKAAQPEFRIVAQMMQDAYDQNIPNQLGYGEWHHPGISDEEYKTMRLRGKPKDALAVAVGRLARWTSYGNKTFEPWAKSIERHDQLSTSGHWSPFEHIATPLRLFYTDDIPFSGNFRGWRQYRKDFKFEDNFRLLTNANR